MGFDLGLFVSTFRDSIMVMQLAVNQRPHVGLWRFKSFSRSRDNIEEQTQGGSPVLETGHWVGSIPTSSTK